MRQRRWVIGTAGLAVLLSACGTRLPDKAFQKNQQVKLKASTGALSGGTGSELRRPLGITIIGGLIVSQMLTLFTTPVIYLYFDRLHLWWEHVRASHKRPEPQGSET